MYFFRVPKLPKLSIFYLLGYKNRFFEYASLKNSGVLVFFRLIFDHKIYFRVRKFYGLVFFRVVF